MPHLNVSLVQSSVVVAACLYLHHSIEFAPPFILFLDSISISFFARLRTVTQNQISLTHRGPGNGNC